MLDEVDELEVGVDNNDGTDVADGDGLDLFFLTGVEGIIIGRAAELDDDVDSPLGSIESDEWDIS